MCFILSAFIYTYVLYVYVNTRLIRLIYFIFKGISGRCIYFFFTWVMFDLFLWSTDTDKMLENSQIKNMTYLNK